MWVSKAEKILAGGSVWQGLPMSPWHVLPQYVFMLCKPIYTIMRLQLRIKRSMHHLDLGDMVRSCPDWIRALGPNIRKQLEVQVARSWSSLGGDACGLHGKRDLPFVPPFFSEWTGQ